jgi:hypothetical protein
MITAGQLAVITLHFEERPQGAGRCLGNWNKPEGEQQ